jgi:hypothetical protein
MIEKTAEKTPDSLYALAATLVNAGVVELEAVYAHLAPADNAAVEAHSAAVEVRRFRLPVSDLELKARLVA